VRKPLFFLVLLLSLLGAWIAGCSQGDRPELAEATGTITLDGKPLAGATVLFRPSEGGRPSRGFTDDSGRYELTYIRDIKGAQLGSHQVIITTATEQQPEERLPGRYNQATTLTAEVQAGSGSHDFELSSR